MNTIPTRRGILAATLFLSAAAVVAADNLAFDGLTTGGWNLTLLNGTPGSELLPVNFIEGAGYNGIRFDDKTPGTLFYSVPAAMLATDWTGRSLNFNYEINDVGSKSGTIVPNVADIYVNGKGLTGYDVIDDSIIDSMQYSTIDFSDPAFSNAGIDVSDIKSLLIRAEWWTDEFNGPVTESRLFSVAAVPEPSTFSLIAASLLVVCAVSRGGNESPARRRSARP